MGLIDKDDAERVNTCHGTCEAYSTRLRKWFLIDPMYGMYYTKHGIPLSAYEIDCEWEADEGKDIRIINLDGEQIPHGRGILPNQSEFSRYHFFKSRLLMDPFPSCGNEAPQRSLFFEDKARRERIWYNGPPGHRRPRRGSDGDLLPTERVDDFYFDVNLIHMETRPRLKRGVLGVSFSTFTPNLSHFLYQVDGGAWRRFSGRRPWTEKEARFYRSAEEILADDEEKTDDAPADRGQIQQHEVPWKIHKGVNTFAVKPVNRFGREGGVSCLEAEVE